MQSRQFVRCTSETNYSSLARWTCAFRHLIARLLWVTKSQKNSNIIPRHCKLSMQSIRMLEYKINLLGLFSLKGGDNARPAAPSPPNNISYEGEIYVLHKSSSVRQGTEVMRGASIDHQHTQSSQNLSTIVSESVLDLESQQKSTACEVSYSYIYRRSKTLQFLDRSRVQITPQMKTGANSSVIATD